MADSLGSVSTSTHEPSVEPLTGDWGFSMAVLVTMLVTVSIISISNNKDMHVRKYTYKTINAAIPIFCGVLLYGFLDRLDMEAVDLVEREHNKYWSWAHYFVSPLEGLSILTDVPMEIIVRCWIAVCMLIIFRVGARLIARTVRKHRPPVSGTPGMPERSSYDQRALDGAAKRALTIVRVLAYTNGFAAAAALTGLLEGLPLVRSWYRALLVMALSMMIYGALFVSDHFIKHGRACVRANRRRSQSTDVTECSAGDSFTWAIASLVHDDDIEELRCEVVTDGENDTLALIGSIIFVREIQKAMESKQLDMVEVAVRLWIFFFFARVAFVLFGTFVARVPSVNIGFWHGLGKRCLDVIVLWFAMVSCWSFFYAVHKSIYVYGEKYADHEGAWYQLKVFRSASTTVACTVAFAVYLWVSRRLGTVLNVSRAAMAEIEGRYAYDAIGVGFAWEKLFDISVETVSEQSPHPLLTEFLFVVFILAVVIPSWRAWVVPMDEEHGYIFGFVPRVVVKSARRELRLKGTNVAAYRKAYKEMVNELSIVLDEIEALEVQEAEAGNAGIETMEM
eukprot:TRINITY_DN10452_c0_g2_i1.p1 TRINITY_DN10452_c0_g2~~TRINITY_DN10452_c0_g2_i1.p1  ORF type:complete len:575 (+),score=67.52 TRINITY_DN10452_c0_g2_i1:35-1726(+)